MNAPVKKISTIAVAALMAASLTACSNSQKDSTAKVETATEAQKPAATASKSAEQHGDIVFEDTFVKAKPAEKDMTGIFGTLKNNSGKDIKLESFSTNLNAGKYEIHEVVNGVMQEKQGGLTIPAGGEYILKPGGDHLMIMDLKSPVEAGSTVKVTLNFSNGTSTTVDSEVRTISSGQENYGANGGVQGNSGMTSAPAHQH